MKRRRESENRRNGLNQPRFTVDLSAQMPVVQSEKTSTLVCDQMSKSTQPCAPGDVMLI